MFQLLKELKMTVKYLGDNLQKRLRNLNIISENEVVGKQGDLFVAVNVLTQEKRNIVVDSSLLGESESNPSKRVLKG